MINFYRDIIIDHYRNPRNFGHLSKPDVVYEKANMLCGDKIHVELNINYKKNTPKISQIRFTGEGCAINIATASMLSEYIQGKPVSILQNMLKDDILKLINIELTPTRLKCALLPLEVLQEAVGKWRK